MIASLKKSRQTLKFKFLNSIIISSFFTSLILPPSILHAQNVTDLPMPAQIKAFSEKYNPASIIAVKVNSDDPLLFDFIVDRGDSGLTGDALEAQTQMLVKYFLAAMTTPDEELWVNLSPYEKDLMIPYSLGLTELGKEMLSQDYLLKQITASLTNPEVEIGKKFWDRVYKKAYELYGTTEIPINTFSKVWIIPKTSVVLEKEGVAFVAENTLTVMLEEDYLAIQKNLNNKEIGTDLLAKERVEYINNISSQIVNEVILPELEKEINEGKNFAPIRQVFNSVILATWYKQRLKESLLSKVYVDKNKIAGVDVNDEMIKEKIYDQYMSALKEGVYNLVRNDRDVATDTTIERKYFSGGMAFQEMGRNLAKVGNIQYLSSPVQQRINEDLEAINIQAPTKDGNPRFVNATTNLRATAPRVTLSMTDQAVARLSPEVIMTQIGNQVRAEERPKVAAEIAAVQSAVNKNPAVVNNAVELRNLVESQAPTFSAVMQRSPGLAGDIMNAVPRVDLASARMMADQAVVKLSPEVIMTQIGNQVRAEERPKVAAEIAAVQSAVNKNPAVVNNAVELRNLVESQAPTFSAVMQRSPGLAGDIMNAVPRVDLASARTMADQAVVKLSPEVIMTQIGNQVRAEERPKVAAEIAAVQSAVNKNPAVVNNAVELRNLVESQAPTFSAVMQRSPGLAGDIMNAVPRVDLASARMMADQAVVKLSPEVIMTQIGNQVRAEERPKVAAEIAAVQSAVNKNPAVVNNAVELRNLVESQAPTFSAVMQRSPGLAGDIMNAVPRVDLASARTMADQAVVKLSPEVIMTQIGNQVRAEERPKVAAEIAAVQSAVNKNPAVVNNAVELRNLVESQAPTFSAVMQRSPGLAGDIMNAVPRVDLASVRMMADQAVVKLSPEVIMTQIGNQVRAEERPKVAAEIAAVQSAVNKNPAVVNNAVELRNLVESQAPTFSAVMQRSPGLAGDIMNAVPRVDLASARMMADQAVVKLSPEVIMTQIGNQVRAEERPKVAAEIAAVQSAVNKNPAVVNNAVELRNLVESQAPTFSAVMQRSPGLAGDIMNAVPRVDLASARTMADQAVVKLSPEVIMTQIGNQVRAEERPKVAAEIAAVQSAVNKNPAVVNNAVELRNLVESQAPTFSAVMQRSPGLAGDIMNAVPRVDLASARTMADQAVVKLSPEVIMTQIGNQVRAEERPKVAAEIAAVQSAVNKNPAVVNNAVELRNLVESQAPTFSAVMQRSPGLAGDIMNAVPRVDLASARTMADQAVVKLSPEVIMTQIGNQVRAEERPKVAAEIAAVQSAVNKNPAVVNNAVELRNLVESQAPTFSAVMQRSPGLAGDIMNAVPRVDLANARTMADQAVVKLSPEVIMTQIGNQVRAEERPKVAAEIAAVQSAVNKNPAVVNNAVELRNLVESQAPTFSAVMQRSPELSEILIASSPQQSKNFSRLMADQAVVKLSPEVIMTQIDNQVRAEERPKVAAEIAAVQSAVNKNPAVVNNAVELRNLVESQAPTFSAVMQRSPGLAGDIMNAVPRVDLASARMMADQAVVKLSPEVIMTQIGNQVRAEERPKVAAEIAAVQSAVNKNPAVVNNAVELRNLVESQAPTFSAVMQRSPGLAGDIMNAVPRVDLASARTMADQAVVKLSPEVIMTQIGNQVRAEERPKVAAEIAAVQSAVNKNPAVVNNAVELRNLVESQAPTFSAVMQRSPGLAGDIMNAVPRVDLASARMMADQAVVKLSPEVIMTQIGNQVRAEERPKVAAEIAAVQSAVNKNPAVVNNAVELRNLVESQAPTFSAVMQRSPGLAGDIMNAVPRVDLASARTMADQAVVKLSPEVIMTQIGNQVRAEERPKVAAEIAAVQSAVNKNPAVVNNAVELRNLVESQAPTFSAVMQRSPGLAGDIMNAVPRVDLASVRMMADQAVVKLSPEVIMTQIGNQVRAEERPKVAAEIAAVQSAVNKNPAVVNNAVELRNLVESQAPTFSAVMQRSPGLAGDIMNAVPRVDLASARMMADQAVVKLSPEVIMTQIGNQVRAEERPKVAAEIAAVQSAVNKNPAVVNNAVELRNLVESQAPTFSAVMQRSPGLAGDIMNAVPRVDLASARTMADQAVVKLSPEVIMTQIGNQVRAEERPKVAAEIAAVQSAVNKNPAVVNNAVELRNLVESQAPTFSAVMQRSPGLAGDIMNAVPRVDLASARTMADQAVVKLSPEVIMTQIGNQVRAEERPKVAAEIAAVQSAVNKNPAVVNNAVELRNLVESQAPTFSAVMQRSPGLAGDIMNAVPRVDLASARTMADQAVVKLSPEVIMTQIGNQVRAEERPKVAAEIAAVQSAVNKNPAVVNNAVELRNLVESQAPTFSAVMQRSPELALNINKTISKMTSLPISASRKDIQINEMANLVRSKPDELAKLVQKILNVDSSKAQQLVKIAQDLDKRQIFTNLDKLRQESPELARVAEDSNFSKFAGIDLNARMFDFKVKGDGSIRVPVALKEDMKLDFGGLEPIIIQISPATADSLPFTPESSQGPKTTTKDLTLSKK